MTEPLLDLIDVSRNFGALRAVHRVSLSVRAGERHAVIGPNGAGKSTLFGLVAGTVPISSGHVRFDGRDVTRVPERRRVRLGIAKTFQQSSLFLSMTALDNVALAVQCRHGTAHRLLPGGRLSVVDRAADGLARVGLAHRIGTRAAELPHSEQRQLEVALALACEPRLLLLDEPTAGMSVNESARFAALVEALPPEVTVLLIEHDLQVVFRLATVITVLHLGEVLAHGDPRDIRSSPEVREAYLGVGCTEELFIEPEREARDGAALRP